MVLALTGDGEAKQDRDRDAAMTAPDGAAASPASPGRRRVQARRLRLKRVGRFDSPLYVTSPPGDRRRVFVVEQGGRIQVLLNGRRAGRPFLDISDLLTSGGEQGLLSMAFAPDYARSGRFYVDFTDRNGDTRVEEFRRSRRSPNRANRSQPQARAVRQPAVRRTTTAACCCSGRTTCSTSAWATAARAAIPTTTPRTSSTLLGKILRIDPRRSGSSRYTSPGVEPVRRARAGRDEIYAYGLRNPWRFSFDRANGDLYIGDVGQDESARRSTTRRAGRRAGRNFGWSCFEGDAALRLARAAARARSRPCSTTAARDGECSVTGGVVVRDPAAAGAGGPLLYGDFCRGQLRSFRISGGRATGDSSLGLTVSQLSSFGEDARGRVYVTSLNGPVYRLVSR